MSHIVERTRMAYDALREAIRRRDLDAFFDEFVHPDIEWVPLEGAMDVAVSSGHEAVKGRFMAILDVMEDPDIEAGEIIDAGDKVVVAIHLSGRGRASGMDLEETSWYHVVTERDDKAVRIEWYASRDEAVEAAGLEG